MHKFCQNFEPRLRCRNSYSTNFHSIEGSYVYMIDTVVFQHHARHGNVVCKITFERYWCCCMRKKTWNTTKQNNT